MWKPIDLTTTFVVEDPDSWVHAVQIGYSTARAGLTIAHREAGGTPLLYDEIQVTGLEHVGGHRFQTVAHAGANRHVVYLIQKYEDDSSVADVALHRRELGIRARIAADYLAGVSGYWTDHNLPGDFSTVADGYPFTSSLDEVVASLYNWAEQLREPSDD